MNLARRRSPASLATLLLPALLLAGCGSLFGHSKTYPELRDIPLASTTATPEAERERIRQDLERERSGEVPPSNDTATTPSGKGPAVPPKAPPKPQAANEADVPADCGSAAQAIEIAQSIPTLRGTIHGEVRTSRAMSIAGEGITAATRPPQGPLKVQFGTGSADVPDSAMPILKERAEQFLSGGNGTIYVEARGGQTSVFPRGAVRSLGNLSLGLKRASAIANVLIAFGIPSDRIKILVAGEETAATLSESGASDTAEVNFDAGAR